MKIVGYINPPFVDSFTVPVYRNDKGKCFFHVLDDEFRVTEFKEAQIEKEYVTEISELISIDIGEVGGIAFVGIDALFVGPASHIIDRIRVYLNGINYQIPSAFEEIRFLSTALGMRDKSDLGFISPLHISFGLRDSSRFNALSSSYSFLNFFVGSSNHHAWELTQNIARDLDAVIQNPLVIYGERGVGKTHLMYALVNAVRNRSKKVQYFNSGKFSVILNLFEGTRRHESLADLIQRNDLVIFDDIQQASHKVDSYRAMFKFIQKISESGTKVILTTSIDPANVEWMGEESFVNRMGSTLVRMKSPEFNIRRDYLINWFKAAKIEPPATVLEYLTSLENYSLSDLNGIFAFVADRYAGAIVGSHAEISVEDLKSEIGMFDFKPYAKFLDLEVVISIVRNYFEVSLRDWYIKKDADNVLKARQAVLYIADNFLNSPLESINARLRDESLFSTASQIQEVKIMSNTNTFFKRTMLEIYKRIFLFMGRLT